MPRQNCFYTIYKDYIISWELTDGTYTFLAVDLNFIKDNVLEKNNIHKQIYMNIFCCRYKTS